MMCPDGYSAAGFFHLQKLEVFSLLLKAAHSQNVRWWCSLADVRARSHRCLAASSAQGVAQPSIKVFFNLLQKV